MRCFLYTFARLKPFKWVIDKHESKQSSISNIFHIKSALEADENVKAFGQPNLNFTKVIFIFMSPHLHRYTSLKKSVQKNLKALSSINICYSDEYIGKV